MKFIDTQTFKNNKGIVANIIAAFGIKGLGLVINMLSMPLYMDYFDNNMVLGLWFTILTVMNWILTFDVGIGNGLRNHLTKALTQKKYERGKELTSSAFASLGVITILFVVIILTIIPIINWNDFFNISVDVVSDSVLERCISITLMGIMASFFLHIVSGCLYALQLSSVVNFLVLLRSMLLVAYLFISPNIDTIEAKLEIISIVYAIIFNVPYIVALVYVFCFSKLKNCRPTLKYVSKDAVKSVLNLGVSFFICQVMYMIITITNEWFISKFFSPEYCVEYQVYFRIFSLVGSLVMLTMTPLWSAITKAYTQQRYSWIIKLQRVLNYLALICVLIECLLICLLQPIINVWLGDKAIDVDYLTAFYFLLYGVAMIWVAIQSTITSGLGTLKTQLVGYLFAAIFKVIAIVIITQFTEDWSIVVLVSALGLLPYCLYQPISIRKELRKLELKI